MNRGVLTIDDLIGKVHMRNTLHYDTRDTAVWQAVCVEYPQIGRETVFHRKTKITTDAWFVDGNQVLDLDEAVEVMNGEKVPLGIQIEGLKRQIEGAGDDRTAIESAIKTLEWCAANADELRQYRKWKKDQS